jgi:hypothetical protein
LLAVDTALALDAKATVPPSQDSTGEGTDAPTVDEIGELGGGGAVPTPGELVTTGDVVSPETVYGDDGDVVIV